MPRLILTRVCSFMYLEVFRSSKYFPTTRKRARERFFTGVHSDVIYKFVLRLKGFSFPRTLFPKADMIRLFWPPDMFHCEMCNKLHALC